MHTGFEFDAPINRVWKDAESGRMFFEGVASTTSVDTQKERTSDRCIKSMATQTGLDIFNEHKRVAGNELGVTTEAAVVDGALVVKGELFDDVPEAVRIYNRMAQGKVYGLSIGGKTTAAHWEVNKSGQRIRVLDDIALHHICITPNPANTDTWTAIVAKSAEGIEEFEMTQEAAKDMGEATADAIPVEVVAISNDMPLPPTSFSENIAQPSAEERFDEVYERMYPLLDALRETIRGVCGAAAEERPVLFATALADFQAAAVSSVSEEIAKAGARHTAAEVEMMHSAIASIQKACGCDSCAAVEKTADTDEGGIAMPAETEVVEKTDDAAEVAVASEVAAEDVAEEAAAVDETPAEEAAETAETETTDAPGEEAAKTAESAVEAAPVGDDVNKAMSDRIAALEAEVQRLRDLPAEGGPVAKTSGDEEQGNEPPSVDLVAKAADAKDRPAYFLGLAGKLQGMNTTVAP